MILQTFLQEFFAVIYEADNGDFYIYVNPTGWTKTTESPMLMFDGLFTDKQLALELKNIVLSNNLYKQYFENIKVRRLKLFMMPLEKI